MISQVLTKFQGLQAKTSKHNKGCMRAFGWKQCRKISNILQIISNQIKSGPECYPGNGFLDLAHIRDARR